MTEETLKTLTMLTMLMTTTDNINVFFPVKNDDFNLIISVLENNKIDPGASENVKILDFNLNEMIIIIFKKFQMLNFIKTKFFNKTNDIMITSFKLVRRKKIL
jgi:hypothetical protein